MHIRTYIHTNVRTNICAASHTANWIICNNEEMIHAAHKVAIDLVPISFNYQHRTNYSWPIHRVFCRCRKRYCHGRCGFHCSVTGALASYILTTHETENELFFQGISRHIPCMLLRPSLVLAPLGHWLSPSLPLQCRIHCLG